MFKKILFPVDLSNASALTAPYVKEMADKFQAQVHLLFVARGMMNYQDVYVPSANIAAFGMEITKGGQKKLDEFVQSTFKGREVVAKVVSGDPGTEIIVYAQNEKMDLIVMGTHGRKGIGQIVFGSVANHVVKNVSVPVLMVHPYSE
jgi:nucleotide-binding universal stress UspA family protein